MQYMLVTLAERPELEAQLSASRITAMSIPSDSGSNGIVVFSLMD